LRIIFKIIIIFFSQKKEAHQQGKNISLLLIASKNETILEKLKHSKKNIYIGFQVFLY
jgi:hypothetical protein